MKYLFVAIATFFLSYTVDIGAVNGQVRCGARDMVIKRLFDRFGEERLAVATSSGNFIEFFVNVKTRTWTILLTPPGPKKDRKSCVLGSGRDYYSRPLEGLEKGKNS